MPAPLPALGSMVHYVAHGSAPRPDGTQLYPSVCRVGLVTETDPARHDTVGLVVLNPGGIFFRSLAEGGCRHSDDTTEGGSWHLAHHHR